MINKKIINRAIFEMICYNCYKNNNCKRRDVNVNNERQQNAYLDSTVLLH